MVSMLTCGMNKCLLPDDELIRRYQIGEPLATLVESAGISRVGIWKRLRRIGVRPARNAPAVSVSCHTCHARFARSRHRVMKARRSFCSPACYVAWMSGCGHGFPRWRHGQRIARGVVANYRPLPPGSVVHHHDGNCRNNAVANLSLFASQSDHMRHHRGDGATMLWDGRTVGV